MNLVTIFLTGLVAGGLTCLAVQGGLLATVVASKSEIPFGLAQGGRNSKSETVFPILVFLGAKLVAYTILGMLLGLLGQAFQFSIQTQAILAILVAIFMIGTALNLLNVHPIFRHFVIQPPRFLTRVIREQSLDFARDKSKSREIFAPALLGAFTVFIPCGTTQAMMALAIASGSPLSGALIMFAFVLGTSPLFFILGYLATRLGEVMQKRFFRLAAAAIIGLAVFNLNNALALTGTSFAVEAAVREVFCTVTICTDNTSLLHDVVKDPMITIGPGGYTPNQFSVKAGSTVTLKLVNNGGGGCAAAFTIPSLGVRQVVQVGETKMIAFVAPMSPGMLPFMCSMGMYRGTINVI